MRGNSVIFYDFGRCRNAGHITETRFRLELKLYEFDISKNYTCTF